MLTYKIHLIRHGMTQGNMEKRFIGITDIPLCEQGRIQLFEKQKKYEYPQVSRVYSSPLLRARETAEILYPDRQIVIKEDLREYNFGDFEGRTIEDLQADPVFQKWISTAMVEQAPNGESSENVKLRAMHAIASIFADMMRDKLTSVAVVTHGALITALLAEMGFAPRKLEWGLIENGEGYTALLSTQMWMRDHKFEIYGKIPYLRETELDTDFEYDDEKY